MKMKTYKYRIYPNITQAAQIEKTISVCRLVYNLALETKIRAYDSGVTLSAYDLHAQLPELKEAHPWMKDVNSQALCAEINKLDRAYKSFFAGSGFPNYRKRKGAGSFEVHSNRRRIDWGKSKLIIPIISPINIRLSRKFEGEIRKIVIVRTATGKFFASVVVKENKLIPNPVEPKVAVGIDLGITHFAILSTGEKINNPNSYKESLKRLKVVQRRTARKKRGSQNQKKAYRRLAILHEKISNRRADFLQKLSTQIICDNQADTICIEDLSVRNMVKNRNVAQAISSAGWSAFVRQLHYKSTWNGKNLFTIGRFEASSKTCSCCGQKINELSLSQRNWICSNCGAEHDRDINAAINIKNIGLSGKGIPVEPAEVSALVEPMKQEEASALSRKH